MDSEASRVLLPAVAYVLNEIVNRNNDLAASFSKADATIFHGLKPPSITIRAYLERIMTYSPCSVECFVLALVYVDRIMQANWRFLLTSLNVHRLLLTAVMTAVKYHDDCSYNNAYYAKVGGIPLGELNALEIELLFLLGFDLHVSAEVFDRYHAELLKHVPVALSNFTGAVNSIASSILPSVTSVTSASPTTSGLHLAMHMTRPEAAC